MSQAKSNTNIREFCPVTVDNMKRNSAIKIKNDSSRSTNTSYWNSLYFVVILGCNILTTSILTLIPRQNSVLYPSYWYEIALMYITVIAANATFTHILEIYIYLNITSLASLKMGLKYLFRSFLVVGIPYLTCYLIWTVILGSSHPMPFLAFITFMATWILYFLLI